MNATLVEDGAGLAKLSKFIERLVKFVTLLWTD
jgi:hypothetical protein